MSLHHGVIIPVCDDLTEQDQFPASNNLDSVSVEVRNQKYHGEMQFAKYNTFRSKRDNGKVTKYDVASFSYEERFLISWTRNFAISLVFVEILHMQTSYHRSRSVT